MRRAIAGAVVVGAMLLGGAVMIRSGVVDGARVSERAITETRMRAARADSRMKAAYRRPPVSGWTQVHLEGTPGEIGYQHGVLLSAEIADLQKVYALEMQHDDGKDWKFLREAS